jgi:site-specific DNA-cytosine methylase
MKGAAHGDKIYEYRPLPKGSRDKTVLFPTVTLDSSSERSKRYAQGGMPLTMAVSQTWPTPRANKVSGDSVARFLSAKAAGKVSTPPLETAVWMADAYRFPTPTKSTAKGIGPIDSKSHAHNLGKRNLHAVVQESVGRTGKLSPEWTELLMGFPKEYTMLTGEPMHDMVIEWGSLLPISEQSDWEVGTPRQTTIMENRAKRIRALGNAVVPACALHVVQRFLDMG